MRDVWLTNKLVISSDTKPDIVIIASNDLLVSLATRRVDSNLELKNLERAFSFLEEMKTAGI